jgi:hypothetical protein
VRYISAHDPSPIRYIRGIVGDFTIYQLILSAASIADLFFLFLSRIAPKRIVFRCA